MSIVRRDDVWVWLGLTAVLLGYFLVWLPHRSAGLSLIGHDISEWVKFLPQMRSGELPNRHLFYLPPVTFGLLLALLTAGWPNRRWQTWVARGLAVLVGLLALPALEAIQFEPSAEWLPRLLLSGLVVVAAGLASLTAVWRRWPLLRTLLIWLVALSGAVLPLYAYLQVRPVVAALLGESLGIGLGVWLTTAGHLLVLAGVAQPTLQNRA